MDFGEDPGGSRVQQAIMDPTDSIFSIVTDAGMLDAPPLSTGQSHRSAQKRKADDISIAPEDDIEPEEAEAPTSRFNELDTSLSPIDNVGDAFSDLIKRVLDDNGQNIPDLVKIAKNGGFKITVGTMCSGTEAPIFALKQLQAEFFALTGVELFRFHHVYSVEIEAFKQAYIRRNTDTVVFRDVRDFASPNLLASDLLTALGSFDRLPRTTPDFLIVGTSCIAFSRLNSKKQKGFDESAKELYDYLQEMNITGVEPGRGEVSQLLDKIVSTADMSESDATFFPVLAYILHQRPCTVIFENVQDAPWQDMHDWFCPAIGYTARFMSCDTKDYYMPQTRQRKYLIAFDNDVFGKNLAAQMANDAMAFLKVFQRRASVDVEKFLYNNMDKAIQVDIQQMEFEKSNKTSSNASWWFSQQRHENTRQTEGLGSGHPFSGLKSTGETQFYDRTNQVIMSLHPERVKDASDICLMRGWNASPSYDNRFKTKIYDFSQNVDRNMGTTPFGISICLTPNGAAFLSIQCRWVMGREYLLLQGLPVGALSLSRETYDQLKNLAGNAMTTTVVGATFLSAILAIFKHAPSPIFPPIDLEDKNYIGPCSPTPTPTIAPRCLRPILTVTTKTFEAVTVGAVLDLASRLRVYCFCNGTTMYSSAILWKCIICGTIRCSNCKGNPKHEYEKLHLVPEAFGRETAMLRLMKHLPRVFQDLFTHTISSRLAAEFDLTLELLGFEQQTVTSLLTKSVFYFDRVHWSETISICYTASSGFSLKIMIDTDSVCWYLFLDAHSALGKLLVDADKKTPINHKSARLRDFCLRGRPFARARLMDREMSSIPSHDQWDHWNFQRPCRMIANSKVYNLRVAVKKSTNGSTITIESVLDQEYSANPQAQRLIESVLGTWTHKPDCDVAETSLYFLNKDGEKKLYLFKDPSRIGPAALDTFVISDNPRLLQWHEHREIILTFVPLADFSQQIHKLQAEPAFKDALEGLERLQIATHLDCTSPTCNDDNRLLAEMAIVRGDKQSSRVLLKASWVCTKTNDWANIDKTEQADFFRSLAFTIPGLIGSMKQLSTKNIPIGQFGLCTTCSPPLPPVYWVNQVESSALQPIHKPEEVGMYESGLRNQLPAFQVVAKVPPYDKNQRRMDDIISVKLAINPSRLAHRALAFLPDIFVTLAAYPTQVSLACFTEPGHSDSLVFDLKPFSQSIPALKMVPGENYVQPPSFPKDLKLEAGQLVTVRYMLDRERLPKVFKEREDEEEVVPGLPLRIVGRAERDILCASGIIADAVGAGKTVMMLALIDQQTEYDYFGYMGRDNEASIVGAKALQATLLFVPEHIIDQWVHEILRFLRNLTIKDVMILRTMRDLYSEENIRRISGVRIVVASDSLFRENSYREELSKFAGRGDPGKTVSERAYREWQRSCVANIRGFLREYLNPHADFALHEWLARRIEHDYLQYQETNQQLVNGMVGQSSRKAARSNESTKAQKTPAKIKSRNIVPLRMFMENCILFEYFSWARIVWDEISYRNIEVAQFLSTAATQHKWLLSGTIPRQNLADIDYMARTLGISLARPIDLRLGLPPITKGPSESVRTDTELCCSYGRLKSDKFVKDRHEQGELFLGSFSCSNKALVLKTHVHERVIVCAPNLFEMAIYSEKQQSWRRAQMNSDRLDTDDLLGMLKGIGHTPGTPLPDDLSSRTLSYAASLPTLGQGDNFSMVKLHNHRCRVLETTQDYIKSLFELAIWLACRLEECSKEQEKLAIDGAEIVKVTAQFHRLIEGLEKGQFDLFGGVKPYTILLEALVPHSTVNEKELLAQARSKDGIDLVALYWNQLAPQRHRNGDIRSILHELYEVGSFSWPQFYKITAEDCEKMDRKNLLSLVKECFIKCYPVVSHVDKDKQISAFEAMTNDELRQTLIKFLEDVHAYQEKRRQDLSNPGFDASSLSKKSKEDLVAEARVRGLKTSSTMKRRVIVDLITAHESGGASQSNYDSPSVHALMPSECPPMLDVNVQTRGSYVSETRNAFKETVNQLSQGLKILIEHTNQRRRAKMFWKLQQNTALKCIKKTEFCNELLVNLDCGHVVCRSHLANKELCGEVSSGCQSVVEYNAVPLTGLMANARRLQLSNAVPDQLLASHPSSYSSKLNSIVRIVKQIPANDSVVVFTQYVDIIQEVLTALQDNGIDARTTSQIRSVQRVKPSIVIEGFKQGEFRVLVLKVDAAEAAGANLVVANHVIFATPLATSAQDLYETCMEQAKGRCARRGQTKDVFLYHCVVEGTIEVDMLECRTKKHVRVQPGRSLGWLAPRDSPETDMSAFPEYDWRQGSTARVNSILRQSEVWKALGETNYTTIASHDKSTEVKDATIDFNEIALPVSGYALKNVESSDRFSEPDPFDDIYD